mmetsp:Transcript_148177/g.359718  ORF Transcript_148177/g.359718 Transcript_148177/m.359718 type:complete len:90 (-) Transcript_148177:25-294(-)
MSQCHYIVKLLKLFEGSPHHLARSVEAVRWFHEKVVRDRSLGEGMTDEPGTESLLAWYPWPEWEARVRSCRSIAHCEPQSTPPSAGRAQ